MIRALTTMIQRVFTIAAIAIVCIIGLFILTEIMEDESVIVTNQKGLTKEVIAYKSLVRNALQEYELEEYTSVVLALMMQESGGRGNDPMQASESLCGKVGCIQNAKLSINQGVSHFASVLEKASGDVRLALQSYNYGPGFISYVKKNGGVYTEQLAIDYSTVMYERLKHEGIYSCLREEAKQYNACYGDIYYVQAVLDYYPAALEIVEGDVIQVALIQ